MCRPDQVEPASAADALAAVRAGLGYLAGMHPADLTISEQADLLRGLAQCESVQLAAGSAMFTAFQRACGPEADGAASGRAWLRWQTQITHGAAGHAAAWARRLSAHPLIAAALGRGEISPSYARHICEWTDEFSDEHQQDADDVLLDAAAWGLDVTDLARLAAEIAARTARPDPDGGDDAFARRWLRLTPHWRGHARLDGDLTPQAAAAVRAVLDALGGRAGPEDLRSQAQRDHDALEEACRRLTGAGNLPDRAGQPTMIQLQMTLRDLLALPGAGDTLAAYAGSGLPAAPPGADCDARIQPVVTGHLDADLLGQLTAAAQASLGYPACGDGSGMAPSAFTRNGTAAMTGRAIGQLTIAQALALLSGPGSITAALRTDGLPGMPAATVSLPLDIGAATETIPPHLRRAIIRRDQHCAFPGCIQPPAACHVHHLIPRADGGTTSLTNCLLLCSFHHLIAVHGMHRGRLLAWLPRGARAQVTGHAGTAVTCGSRTTSGSQTRTASCVSLRRVSPGRKKTS